MISIDLDVDVKGISSALTRATTSAISNGIEDALRYGSLGREIKEAAAKMAADLAREVLADPTFRDEARAALRKGIIAGLEERGKKVARGMDVQRALDLTAAPGGEG